MEQEMLRVEQEGGVLRVLLNRPEKRNALSRALLKCIEDAFTEQAANNSLLAAVITGAGDKSFAAGGDLADLGTVRTPEATREMAAGARAALDAIRNFPLPVIAALNGDALGGGAELAVACDFRVAAAHARIGFLQSRLNISSAWGGGGDLMELIGSKRALKLLCTAEIVPPEKAIEIGLFDEVAGATRTLEETLKGFIDPLEKKSAQVLRAYKGMAIEARRWSSRAEFDVVERDAFVETWVHPDHWAVADNILKKS